MIKWVIIIDYCYSVYMPLKVLPVPYIWDNCGVCASLLIKTRSQKINPPPRPRHSAPPLPPFISFAHLLPFLSFCFLIAQHSINPSPTVMASSQPQSRRSRTFRPPKYSYDFSHLKSFPHRLLFPPHSGVGRVRSFKITPVYEISLDDVLG